MRILLLYLFSMFQTVALCQNSRLIHGEVTDGFNLLHGVNVTIDGTDSGTQTDEQGRYSIEAKPQDIIVFSHMGMKPMKIVVEDVTSLVNIKMIPKTEMLPEVVVEKKRRKTQKELEKDFVTNKKLVRTNYGILDADKVGFTMRVLDGDDIKLGFINILDVLQARFPGVYLKPNLESPYLKTAYLNRTKSLNKEIPLLFEVDGVVTFSPPFIAITEVDRLALIPGVGGTIRYGTRGAGGVVIINTKRGFLAKRPDVAGRLGIKTFTDSEAMDYKLASVPKYMDELRASKSLKEAIGSFKESMNRATSPYFYVDAYSYFSKNWNHQPTMDMAADLVVSKFGKNAVVLKALAYKHEEASEYEKAMQVYQKVFDLRPEYEQSYRDVAHAFHQIGDAKASLRYYMFKKGFPRFEKEDESLKDGIDLTILTELNTLVAEPDIKGLETHSMVLGDVPAGTRLLFEWNNGEAEFDIQFVNPAKKYFTWSHTMEKNEKSILDEKLRGYSSKQFFLDGNAVGNWQINLNYFGNKSFEPTYIKVTIWTNYGTSYQGKMVKLFRFEEKNINYKLFTILNDPLVEAGSGK